MATPLEQIAYQILEGNITIPIKTFTLDQIVEAHQAMEDSTALAKIVVLV
jgi:D-arabinose 1-dehydrogenase-like Zn-dependent alcohol dehydrogenase